MPFAGTDPYSPRVGATLDNAPLVVEGGEVFPTIPGPLSHVKPASRAAGHWQTHMYRPYMTCQSFTIATVE